MSCEILLSLLFTFIIVRSSASPEEFFNTTPYPIKSNFTCNGRQTGYYADVPSNCRVYHNCDDQGNKFSYYCPEMTAFRQEALICDHAHLVDCQSGTRIGKTKKEETQTIFAKSNSDTIQNAGRWTSENPFRDFFLMKKNLSSTHFGFHFRNGSESNLNSRRHQDQSGKDPSRFFRLKENLNETRFFGNNLGRPSQKINEDQVETNSRSDFHSQRHPEVNTVKSSTSYIRFGQIYATTKSYFDLENRNYPAQPDKMERKSSQIPSLASRRNSQSTSSTSDIPLRDFTASLKPLVPNVLEYDPYYPRESWATTESYYTPSERNELPLALEAPNFEPSIFGVYFKIPDVWPDLNTLDDIVDRRKFFYIPKTRKL